MLAMIIMFYFALLVFGALAAASLAVCWVAGFVAWKIVKYVKGKLVCA
jgi:hypothetical protein